MGHDLKIPWADLRARDVHLVPHHASQDARTVAWLNDPEIQAGFGVARDFTLEGHRRWLAERPDVVVLAIVESATEEHIGNALLAWNERHRSAYFQVYLGPAESRGRGYGQQATALALRAAFEGLRAHRVWLHVLLDNPRGAGIYESLGFRDEGVEREALWLRGAWVSQRRMSILEEEWRRSGGGACASR